MLFLRSKVIIFQSVCRHLAPGSGTADSSLD
jgi:hypothetical protein